jgi:hypothetical protein
LQSETQTDRKNLSDETFVSPLESEVYNYLQKEIDQTTAAVLDDNQYIGKIIKTQRLKIREIENLDQQIRFQVFDFNNVLKKRKETIKYNQKLILMYNEELYNKNKLSKEELEEYKNKYATEKFYSFYTPKVEIYNDKYKNVVKRIMSTQCDS